MRVLPLPALLTLLAFSTVILISSSQTAVADDKSELSWIWTPEAKETMHLPAGTRWFRKTFEIDRPIANPVDEALLELTADDGFTVWFNGHEVGLGDTWRQIYRFDVKKWAKHGTNVIAVAATNTTPSAAGLLARIAVTPNGKSKMAFNSDASWKSTSTEPAANWTQVDFNDSAWNPVHVIGSYGTNPWGKINWDSAPTSSRFTVPEGFVVETVVPPTPNMAKVDNKLPFSIINMTFDNRGRLLVSQERGPVLLCTDPNSDGVMQNIRPYCKQVKNAQGLCWVRDALLVVGDGPKGTGLYRAKDTKGADETDEVELLHKFKGSMGEHGPHAIIHGPDDWLYVVIGNHAWAQPEKLAENSPLKRWPKGDFGPDQGKPNTTEDVLLPRLNDGRGHAANILAPGGTIWRMDHEGKNISQVAAGFRNHFDAAFRSDGELFTFDSDMEWDEGLPWYRAVRVCHVPPGADYVWRTGAANTPNYYIDSLQPILETGRGSPTGLTFYEHHQFPKKYQGAFFMADWSIGVIWAVHLKQNGASFKGESEKFCVGAPLNVTDLEVGPDGCLYFALGGRGSAGGIYKIKYTGQPEQDKSYQTHNQPLAAWSTSRSTFNNPQSKPPALETCLGALKSGDAMKARHACEDIIRYGYEVSPDQLWPLLNSADQFLRTAARLVLQRIEPAKWIDKLSASSDLQAMEAIIALCKTNQMDQHKNLVLDRLARLKDTSNPEEQLQQLRTWQMAIIHSELDGKQPVVQKAIQKWFEMFPTGDDRVNRELAILLVNAHKQEWTNLPVPNKLVDEMTKSLTDRKQQIYYFYILRLLHRDWSEALKQSVLTWFEQTKSWTGGHSFTPFMENIFFDWSVSLDQADRAKILSKVDQWPFVVSVLLRSKETHLSTQQLVGLIENLSPTKDDATRNLRDVLVEQLGKSNEQVEAQKSLRLLTDRHPELLDAALRSLTKSVSSENVPYYLSGLRSASPLVLRDSIVALLKAKYQPKAEDAETYRCVLLGVSRLADRDRMEAIKLLQHWKKQQFSPDGKDLQAELKGWSRWYGQQFPKATPLLNVSAITASSKWKMDELRNFLEKDEKGLHGDVARGKLVFTKANCIKCHKFGSEGDGLGPDLTTLKSRFQRADILESILDPSKVISDQYRGTVIVTENGQTITGLAAPQGDSVTVLQLDGTKITLKKSEIESQVASTVSPMPEKLIDELTLQEIADLFAYLLSTPK
ncbi:MAG TPA: c-type cytochrome [Gemmatales bacterium]|nr:c-type cytochrome [Gemmatales bacterium]